MDWFYSPIAAAEDRDLAARLRTRDPEAAGELFSRYGKLLYALIHNIVPDPQESEDLLAEVFLKAANRVHAFKTDEVALGPWLLILARNHALNSRHESASLEDADRIGSNLETPALYVSRAISADEFLGTAPQRKTFAALPDLDRLVLELAWFEGLSVDEIASRLNLTVPAVVASATFSLDRMRSC